MAWHVVLMVKGIGTESCLEADSPRTLLIQREALLMRNTLELHAFQRADGTLSTEALWLL